MVDLYGIGVPWTTGGPTFPGRFSKINSSQVITSMKRQINWFSIIRLPKVQLKKTCTGGFSEITSEIGPLDPQTRHILNTCPNADPNVPLEPFNTVIQKFGVRVFATRQIHKARTGLDSLGFGDHEYIYMLGVCEEIA